MSSMTVAFVEEDQTDAVSVWQFFRALKTSRLLPCHEVEALERGAAGKPFAEVLAELLRDDHLTEYQIDRLRSGSPQGLVLGRYRILRELGKGGFGHVYQAYHTLMKRVVAIKKLVSNVNQDPITRAMFLREVAASTRLVHPNIAAAFDADECDDELYFVMEFIDGPTLESYVTNCGPLPIPLAQTVLLQTAHALQYGQQFGTVHRDVKPANIMLTGDTECAENPATPVVVKLLDFGLARFRYADKLALDTLPCGTGSILGTPAFIPPEQIADPHSVDIRSDLYSLGCTLFYALTGRFPFNGPTIAATIAMHLHSPRPSVQIIRPEIPSALADIILRLMAKDPDDRFQSPAELIDALRAMTAGVSSGVVVHPDVVEPPTPCDLDPPDTRRASRDDMVAVTIAAVVELVDPYPVETAAPVGATLDTFRPLWDEWYGILDQLGRGGSPRVTPAEYQILYHELRAVLAALAPSSALTSVRIDQISSAIEPWVSLSSLENLDHKMLISLGMTCRSIDREISPQVEASTATSWLLVLTVTLLGLSALFVAIAVGLFR